MPYKVFREQGKFCVHKMVSGEKGELVHCHDSAEMARRQQAALYVSENKELEPEDAIIVEEDGSEYKEYDVPAYTTSATSFEELESQREAQERVHELSELMSDFQNLAGNIVYTPVELLETDKVQELDNLYAEFKSRATELLKEPVKKESAFKRAVNKVKDVLGLNPPPPDMMVYKEEDGSYGWIASYSNKFMDRDNPPDIIASTAHKEFVERVDKGEAPLPELQLWHIPEWKIGYATALAYDDSGFPIAIGRFDDNQESKEVAEWLSKQNDFGVSHGMWNRTIRRDETDPSVIIAYETHEISPLPKSRAANLLADWYVIENEIKELEEVTMTIPDEKRQELLKRGLPESTLSALEERNRKKAETASAEGVKSKETEEVTQPVPEETEAVPETEEPVEDKGAETAPDFPTRQEVAEAIASVLAPKLEEFSTAINELKEKWEETQKQLSEFQSSDEKRIKEMIQMTPRDSLSTLMAARLTDRASSSKQTKVGDNDNLLKTKPREEKTEDTSRDIGIPFIDKMRRDGK